MIPNHYSEVLSPIKGGYWAIKISHTRDYSWPLRLFRSLKEPPMIDGSQDIIMLRSHILGLFVTFSDHGS
jgi:hypothetical protein